MSKSNNSITTEQDSEYFTINSQPLSYVHDVYLYDIGAPREFAELIALLNNVGENDVVRFFINSGGGDLITGMQILNAMETCIGTIITILDGDAASMGGIIFLAGHNLTVYDHSLLMLHNFSLGMQGKSQDFVNYHKGIKDVYDGMVTKYVSRVLSEEEITNMNKGEDIYIGTVELRERLANYAQTLEEKIDESEEQQDMGGEVHSTESE